MKKILCFCLFLTFIFALEDKNFSLPDLFVTAKDLRMFDEGVKTDSVINKTWKAKNYLNKEKVYLSLDKRIVDKINLDDVKTGLFFNTAEFYLGLPSYLSFSIYHGYEWEKKPYFVILNRTIGDRKYDSFAKERGEFLIAIAVDEKNIINFKMLENNIGSARLNSLQIGWRTFWNIPISYQTKIFNSAANATAGNPAVSYFQNNLALDIGDVTVLNTSFPGQVNLDLLNSNNNSYSSIELLLNKNLEIHSILNKVQFGINLWTNKGTTKIGLVLGDSFNFELTKNVQIETGLRLSNSKLKVDDMFKFDLAEIDDLKIEPDEKAEVGVTINNYFGINEKLIFSYSNFSTMKVWDDLDSDGYYSFGNVNDVQLLKIGALFNDVQVISENIDVLVQLPFYNKDIPNQFSKFSEVTYRKDLYGGILNVVGSYYLRELGCSPALYKNAYFNLDILYDQSINQDLWWGLTIGNLLSSGAEKLTGLKFAGPYLYLKFRFIF